MDSVTRSLQFCTKIREAASERLVTRDEDVGPPTVCRTTEGQSCLDAPVRFLTRGRQSATTACRAHPTSTPDAHRSALGVEQPRPSLAFLTEVSDDPVQHFRSQKWRLFLFSHKKRGCNETKQLRVLSEVPKPRGGVLTAAGQTLAQHGIVLEKIGSERHAIVVEESR
jgi:hypothetical protein